MKKLIIITALFALFGCKKEAISSEKTKINNIELELLFEKDGCKMYRFNDGGRNVYWATCEGKTSYSYSTKNRNQTITNHVEEITTKK